MYKSKHAQIRKHNMVGSLVAVSQVCMPTIFIETHTQRADGKQQLPEMSEDHDHQVATVILSR